jgi:hypothetical protein
VRWAYHERMRAFASIAELVPIVRAMDSQLAEVARGRLAAPRIDQPDGYPRGGGGRAGGTSDPTGAAVEQRELQAARLAELAEQAIGAVFRALDEMKAAQALAARALEPPRMAEPERRPPEQIWCISCARARPKELEQLPAKRAGEAIAFEPRTSMTKRSRDDLCSWCLDRWEGSAADPGRRKLPDIRLVAWRADNPHRKVTQQVEQQLLGQKPSQVA